MSKKPTEAQNKYLERVLNRPLTQIGSKVTGQYLDYDRRREKIAAQVKQIPDGHALAIPLSADLAAAKAKADTGSFKGAYQDLKAVKQRARDAARNYFDNLPGEITADIANTSQAIDTLAQSHQAVLDTMDVLAQDIAAEAKVGDCADLDDAYDRREELTAEHALWQGRIDAATTLSANNAGAANNLGIEAKLSSPERLVKVVRENTTKPDPDTANRLALDLGKLDMKSRLDGAYMSGAVVTRSFDEKRHHAEGLIAAALEFGDLQQRAPEPALAKFKALDDREARRIGFARQQMKQAAFRDAAPKVLGGAESKPTVNEYEPETVDVGEILAGDRLANLTDDEIDDNLIASSAVRAASALDFTMAGMDAKSDKMFNLALKGPTDLERDICTELNWPRADLKDQPNRQKMVKEIAKLLYDKATANNPNKMSADASTVTMGGVTYTNKEYLTKGGFGQINRYTDPLTNETVIVKSMNDPDMRKEMVHEMKAHRQVMGGENGVAHPNIVELKGAAVSDDGTLHMILEEAKGGDVNSFVKSVQAAANSGLLSPEASAALTRRTMAQALQGVKKLHEQGLLHLDIKAENFLMADDGTVKLADFGSAQAPAAATGTVAAKKVTTTEEYAPPELRHGDHAVDKKGEVFWLGSMLQGAASNIGIEGEAQRPDRSLGHFETFDMLRTKHGATAFDRLRDAMVDPDPKKRPTLDGVLLSAYMADQAQNFDEDDVEALAQAVVDYSAAVGRKVRDIEIDINGYSGELKRQEPTFTDGEPETSRRAKTEAYEKLRETTMAAIAPFKTKLEAYTKLRSDAEIAALDADEAA